MEKLTRMLGKFVEANKTVKVMCPNGWREKMTIYKLMIADIMHDEKLEHNAVEAAILLASRYTENDNARVWIYATAVEMIEEG
jgi:hypothetical protein